MFCCVRGANGFVIAVVGVVVVIAALGAPNGATAFILPNVDVENGFEEAKVVPVFANTGLGNAAVLPNVSFVLAAVRPSSALANGVEVVLVELNCELEVTNGLVIVADPPNGALLLADIVAPVFCVPKTFGADIVPKALTAGCWPKPKAGVVIAAGPPKVGAVVTTPKPGVVVTTGVLKAGVVVVVDPKILLIGIAEVPNA